MDFAIKKRETSFFEKIFEHCEAHEAGMEAVVPDTMPDIARIISVDGTVIIREKNVTTGQVSVAAGAAVCVLYAPEDGSGLRRLEYSLPFSLTLDAPQVTAESVPVASLRLTAMDARILNPRKVVLRATVSVSLSCWERRDTTFYQRGEDCGCAEMLEESVTISPVVCVTERTFAVTDDYALPAGAAAVGELLCHRVELMAGEVRAVGSRLVVKGRARVSFVYLSAGGGAPESLCFETDFSQLIDADAEVGAPECAVSLLLTAEYIEQTAAGFSAELHLVAQVICRDSLRLAFLSDAYSNACPLELERASTVVQCADGRRDLRETLQCEMHLPSGVRRVNSIICRLGEPVISGGGLRLLVNAEAVCTDEEGHIARATGSFAVETAVDWDESSGFEVQGVEYGEPICLPGREGVEVRVPVEVRLLILRERRIEQLCGIREAESQQKCPRRPSVTVVRAGDTDSLWLLGKRHGSTVSLISELNELEAGETIAGRILLIPASR